ncbi:hypothetical protein COLO4_02931 [Corchorus olitorius]|uniref:Uncharacterized protein n=1 Tax=Corchorus olitorius TaxID=93759 RepID=A0A1R3L009_9ROSI|nr:hypothetical protein COLO4_02931 [Corchorus olitorius]
MTAGQAKRVSENSTQASKMPTGSSVHVSYRTGNCETRLRFPSGENS